MNCLRKHNTAQLSDELALFQQHKEKWLARHRGEFIVLGKQILGGFYRTYPEALQAGIRMFGLASAVLIEEICEEER